MTKPVLTPLRLSLLRMADETGGISSQFISKSEERAAFAMTKMAEPLLRVAYWGEFDYFITEAGRAFLEKVRLGSES